ncbi:AAA family ATPase [Butyrivibrio sp. AD3002]|uniref:AAA family ATPase n=1 Tax=Butyrivibrio sp. AD3002 TaxID=1280670 RepID=UPI0003B51292|nr:AAA family ATPase [Butyrivibrio sp. AD3002]
MTEWFISGNPKKFDLFNAFHDLGKVDWKQSANIEAGDIVYIYVSADHQKIQFKCKVNKVNLPSVEITDNKYNLSGEYDGTYGRYMELEPIAEFDTDLFSRLEMEKHGFSTPQSPVRVIPKVKVYMDIVQFLLNADEMDPDEHDGSYELARETVRAYKNMGDLSGIDYKDLNLLYHMVIGTWKMRIEQKKVSVDNSNLPEDEKKRLKELLDAVWERAKAHKYKNQEDDEISVGMFGTGFYSFDSKDEGKAARVLIGLCTEIFDLTDDDAIYDITEKYLVEDLKGVKAASASVMLHCLKPFTFPILNTNYGNRTIYEYFGIDLTKMKLLTTYAGNCRKIKEFRDKYFGVKNYRIYDIAARMANVKDSNYLTDETENEAYWPSKEEYDPGITTEQWIELLEDSEVTTDNNLQMFAMMLAFGRPATCTQYAERFGQTKNFFSSGSTSLAKRVANKTGCPLPPERISENARWWPVLYIGRQASGEEKGSYVWKLRDELKDALGEVELPEVMEETMMDSDAKFSLNTILYGPPGTGKTYNTVKYAVAICEGKDISDYEDMDYSEILEKYDWYKSQGRIAFTTFHQSYGYEEFIEGIKPVLGADEDLDEIKDIKYDVIPGVFKAFCKEASRKWVTYENNVFKTDENIWKVTIRPNVKKDCFSKNRIRIDFGMDDKYASGFINDIEPGDIVITTDGSRTRINGIAKVESEQAFELEDESDRLTRNVKWLAKDIDVNILEINANKMLHRMTVARVPHMSFEDLLSIIESENDKLAGTLNKEDNPYVFIIDEINRGNISKIFGELITLIEDTKRAGADEAMEAILPYSNELFSVPNNVYILGTMNTADRSIALMDTALRRRFQFKEMMPNADVLRNIGANMVEDLDVAAMLEKINERITFLFDREHTIGHAFFTGLKDEPTVEKLASIFSRSVIPLLQEYFYEDYQKIQFVLGDNAKSDDRYKFIKDIPVVAKDIFKGSVDDIIDLPEKKYVINTEAFNELQSYKEIM